MLSRVSSYDWLVSLGFMPIGFLLFGPVAQAVGLTTTLVAAAGVMAATNLVVAFVPAVHDVATVRPSPPPVPQAAETRAAA